MVIINFDDPSGPNVAGNPLPNHADKGVNAIVESGGKRIKTDVAGGHDIQKYIEFMAMVQDLMDNKELEFYKEIKGVEWEEIYASEEGSTGKA
ncbi:hypothetical protein GOBAR_DD17347 [Gossypium barbadense]|nr:hypothetical protein GOBAR_DD17347 [Gossypium barbadense]